MRAFFLILLSFSYYIPLFAQSSSLAEQLGGIKTDFIISNNDQQLDVSNQIIVKRGLSEFKTDYDSFMDGAYGFGYGIGVETFRLEFMADQPIDKVNGKHKKRRMYQLRFFDQSDQFLVTKVLNNRSIFHLSNAKNLHIYSINLQSIPLVLLERTKRIDIQQVIVD